MRSFIELTEFVFTIPGVKVFVSEKVSQDTLEKFFGCQRQRGGTSDDPTVAEYKKIQCSPGHKYRPQKRLKG